jgi:class 3 adenylate cyclase
MAGLRREPSHLRLRQLLGLALARCGATDRGREVLEGLYRQGLRDAETLGILARTHKDLWDRDRAGPAGRLHLLRAHALYLQAFRQATQPRHTRAGAAVYAGINAATTALLAGRCGLARRLAAQVEGLCGRLMARGNAAHTDYWTLAARGEAALIRGLWDRAEAWYRRAAAAGRGQHGSLASTRRNARLLTEALDAPAGRMEAIFPPPAVAVVLAAAATGPETSAEGRRLVRRAVAGALRTLDRPIVYIASPAIADRGLLASLPAAAGEWHVVLPCPPRTALPALRQAASVEVAVDRRREITPEILRFAALLAEGMAWLCAAPFGAVPVPILVEAGSPAERRLAAAARRRWQARGIRPLTIRLPSAAPRPTARNRPASPPPSGFREDLRAMLFADVAGFSRLADEEIPRFIAGFMGVVAALLRRMRHPPLLRNTWGDSLFLVFDRVEDAGCLALDMVDALGHTAAAPRGTMDVRIALDAGPVYRFADPLTGLANCAGHHVNRAARLEPVTPPGQVYATRSFAALAAAGGVRAFRCEYVGRVPFAKEYGTYPAYHVQRAAPPP